MCRYGSIVTKKYFVVTFTVINFTKYQLGLNEYNHKLFQTIIKPKETLNTKTSIYIANLGKLVTI